MIPLSQRGNDVKSLVDALVVQAEAVAEEHRAQLDALKAGHAHVVARLAASSLECDELKKRLADLETQQRPADAP